MRDIRIRVTPPTPAALGAWGTTGARGSRVPAQRARPAAARETGRIVTVQDHWPEGGLGDAGSVATAAAELVAGQGA